MRLHHIQLRLIQKNISMYILLSANSRLVHYKEVCMIASDDTLRCKFCITAVLSEHCRGVKHPKVLLFVTARNLSKDRQRLALLHHGDCEQ